MKTGWKTDLLVKLTYNVKPLQCFPWAMVMPHLQANTEPDTSTRGARLGFRLDEDTKNLIERAARLSRRKVSDFCVTALADTARRTIAEHETLVLSPRARKAFFNALIHPPAPSERLQRALAEHGRRVVPGA
jgi:uncharacterized protein (DUF1778 family)